jgi:hypothetical protein
MVSSLWVEGIFDWTVEGFRGKRKKEPPAFQWEKRISILLATALGTPI